MKSSVSHPKPVAVKSPEVSTGLNIEILRVITVSVVYKPEIFQVHEIIPYKSVGCFVNYLLYLPPITI